MDKSIEKLIDEVLNLPHEMKAYLAEKLLESLDTETDADISPEWQKEIKMIEAADFYESRQSDPGKRFLESVRSLIIGGMILILSAASISCAGCKNSVQNYKDSTAAVSDIEAVNENYSGTYRLTDAKACNILITIKNDKSEYSYAINGTGVKSSGKLGVVKEGSGIYLMFTGTKRSGDNTVVEGQYSGGKIVIQNYGNSINQYVCFKSCDAKYLEFEKAD